MSAPSAIVVLGMHRSGTSAFTRVINYLGVELGTQLLPAAQDNETGVWEHREIFEIHERLLQSLGTNWHDVTALPESWWRSSTVSPYKRELLEVIDRDFSGASLWAFKDPRVSRLMPLWREIFDEIRTEPGFVILLRNPLEVAGSLARRNGFPLGKTYFLWLRHMIEAEKATRFSPRAFVPYEDLLTDWRNQVSAVEDKLGIRWPVRPSQVDSEIELFLQRGMRHHSVDDADLENEDSLPDLVKDLFSEMRNAARGSNGYLTKVAQEVDRHIEGADKLYSEAIFDSRREPGPSREVETTDGGHTGRQQELQAFRGELLFMRLQLVKHDERSRTRDDRLSRISEELGGTTREIAGLSKVIGAVRRRLAQDSELRDRAIGELSAAREEISAQLFEQQRRIEDLDSKLASILLELEALHKARRGWLARLGDRGMARRPPENAASGRLAGLRSMALRAFAHLPGLLRSPVESWGSVTALRKNILFDPGFYLRRNPDVARRRADPVLHYHRRGRFEKRDPSPFFSTSYYLDRNPDVLTAGVNPLAHFIRHGAREGRDPGPLFETSHYVGSYPDVIAAGFQPLEHFVRYGMYEGRLPCSTERILQLVGPYILEPSRSRCHEYLASPSTGPRDSARGLRVGVYSSSEGNYFYTNIRDLIVEGFRRAGVQALPLDQNASRPGNLTHDLIVAPQEFFYLGKGCDWRSHPMVDSAILVSADQLQTPWFSRCLPFLMRARMVLDINFHVAAALRDLGLDAHFFPLGPLKGFSPFDERVSLPEEVALKSLPRGVRDYRGDRTDDLADRPIDVFFVGTLTPRREKFFAEHAGSMSRHRCFLHWVREGRPPLVEGKTAELSSRAVVGLSQRSKILFNVHRDEVGYFEWHRMVMLGVWQRSLVVTERCFRIPGLNPQEHYFEGDASELPGAIRWFLESPEGRKRAEEMRARAYESLLRNYAFERVVESVIRLLGKLG